MPSTGQKISRSVTPPAPHSPEISVDSPGEEKVVKKPIVLPSTKTSFELFRKQALENAEKVSPLVWSYRFVNLLPNGFDKQEKQAKQQELKKQNKPPQSAPLVAPRHFVK